MDLGPFLPPWKDEIPPKEQADSTLGYHFEGWTLLTALALLTSKAMVGCLVTCNNYRNPALLSNMAKTIDHISGGRLILGIGAGWRETEYHEYGYRFGTATERLQALEEALITIKQRWAADLPLPVNQTIPILIGGDGEKITLRLVAQYADQWNSCALPRQFKHKCAVLKEWCDRLGRDPDTIERSVCAGNAPETSLCDEYVASGADHIILNLGTPWDLTHVKWILQWRDHLLVDD